MYLPKSKYKKEDGAGKQLLDVTGAVVVGPILTDFLGRVFKGSNPVTATEQLTSVDTSQEQEDSPFRNYYVSPTQKDYLQGKFVRYFAKDSRLGKIVELTKEAYLKERRDNKLYRRTLRLEWYITGPVEDVKINGYYSYGARTKNQNVIDQAEKTLSGIGEQLLKDPTQFVK